jgi:hypothetical protein
MLANNLNWFFIIYSSEFRQNKLIVFETIMFLAIAHCLGFYNPKQLADFLGVPHQTFYHSLKELSLYYLKKMLIRFMVKQAAEQIRPVLEMSDATKSRAAISLAIDNSVIDRLGKMLRCTWSWYSGRCKKVVNGQDLLGIVLTFSSMAFPLHLLFCSKQGRANTDKPRLLIAMLKELKDEFEKEGIDITAFPLTLDSWYVSCELKLQLHSLGFKKIVIAGKGNYTFTIDTRRQTASQWKKTLNLVKKQWGVDVPSLRVKTTSPTFGSIVLFFFEKSTTRTYYLMDFSKTSFRSAEIWHIWKQHHIIEHFWKILKSLLKIKSMRLHDDGLYAALLIKVVAYLLLIRLKLKKSFLKFSLTEIMRKIQREFDLRDILVEHFHLPIVVT